ncbi:MAG: 5-oxoprolinase subunit PxpB [Oscillochloridaceae bacterium]|nr:5-oxoprolinase subunit PxpB [Chloroflexaceae bacterium]MDW8392195.1 5-oxoprolinase subunit PxpB [Oscillochloridaceae bacterium]
MTLPWTFTHLGEAALLAEATSGDHEAANRAALAAAAALEAAPPPGFIAATPAIASLLVCFDPLLTDHAAMIAGVRAVLEDPPPLQERGRLVTIPVTYGGKAGPDLNDVAALLGMTPVEVIAAHTAGPFRVMMIGFAPGFPYIGPLPARLRAPRRATPRAAVPPGSVALAAGLTGIYPARLPGGWHVIGRTTLRLFDANAEPPALLAPGDRVQFVADA